MNTDTIKLYPHNQKTYKKIQEMWKTTNRVASVQATGTGKSFLILKCLFDIPDKKKVVLSPSTYIFEQLIEHSEDIIPNVEFITYSKIANMTDEEIQNLNPLLIVLDEFHRCGAEQWGKGIRKLLDIYPDTKVLGTSATPIRYLDNERDMSDELFDGHVAVNLPLAEAIVKGILPMPKYVSALYTFNDEVNNLKGKVVKSNNTEEEKEELLKEIDIMRNKLDRSKGIPKILKKYLTINNGKFIIFCKNKDHLNEMKPIVIDWFKQSGIKNKIKTYTVYTGYKNTDKEFEMFRDNKSKESIKLLFSIEMLNEGVHVEDIDGVVLLRPTTSPIIYYQQIGRAIDAGSDKEPLIFDFVNNFDNIGAKQFVEDLREQRKRELYSRNEYQGKENIDIPEFIVFDEVQEIKQLFNCIESKLIDNWNNMFLLLTEYKKEFGNCLVITKSYYKNEPLGDFCTYQRLQFNRGKLSKDKINKLNSLDFIWGVKDYNFERMLKNLVKFKEENGHCSIPLNYITEDGENLYNWTKEFLKAYNSSDLSNERKERIKKIIEVDPFFLHGKYFKDWYMRYIEYKDNRDELNQSLKDWERNQKISFENGKLLNEQIELLDKINFDWNRNKKNNISENNPFHIVNLLKNSNMSYSQLAYLLNISRTPIGSWCLNKSFINPKYIEKISNIFNVDSKLIQPQKEINYKENSYHIKDILIKNNMLQVELCKILKVKSVPLWCNNRCSIPKKYIKIISEIFSIDENVIEPQDREEKVSKDYIINNLVNLYLQKGRRLKARELNNEKFIPRYNTIVNICNMPMKDIWNEVESRIKCI